MAQIEAKLLEPSRDPDSEPREEFSFTFLPLFPGISGILVNFLLLRIHKRFPDALLDPSGLLLGNFLVANAGVILAQFPLSGPSALAGRSVG